MNEVSCLEISDIRQPAIIEEEEYDEDASEEGEEDEEGG